MRINTPVVKIGNIYVGGKNPIAIQSMTDTETKDVVKTVNQCIELANAGAEIVRMTIPDESAAKAVSKIRESLNKKGYKNLALVGDFHFNGHLLLETNPKCAKALDKYRINPGNVNLSGEKDENFEKIIKIALKNKKPVRIGVNSGSLDQSIKEKDKVKALIKSVISSAKHAEKLGLKKEQIVLSVKTSDVNDIVKVNELLISQMKKNKKFYAIHLGLTESGSGLQGIISSTSALAILLNQGIGDTIRVSITPNKNTPRTEEVKICKNILQSLGLRSFRPKIISCPGCGRTNKKLFQQIVEEINEFVDKNFAKWIKKNPKTANLKIAVMGCVVNGPGESKTADISIHLPGNSEQEIAQIYVKGKFLKTVKDKSLSKEFMKIIKKEIKI